MHVPGAFFAINPGDGAAELGDEVVTARLVAIPPAAGYALGTGDERELGLGYATRRGEEPRRPRSGLHEIVRVPVARFDAAPCMLRAVIREHGDAINGIAAEARLQPLEELGPVLRLGGTVAEEAAAWRTERSEIASIERDGLYRLRQRERR